MKVKSLSLVRLFATPWTVACQAPLSVEFSRQELWSGLPFPPPRDLPDPGIKSRSPAFQADSLPSEPLGNPTLYRIYAGGKHSMLRTYQMSINTGQSGKSHIKDTCYHRRATLLRPQGSGCSTVHMKGTGQSS